MFQKIILPFGADLLMWTVAYLLRTNPKLRESCPLPGGPEVGHVPGDRYDWRAHLPGVTDEMKTVRQAEEALQCVFVGVDDGTGILHLREDAAGNQLPPRLLPNMQDVVDGIADDLTTSEKKLISLVQEPAAFMADPSFPAVDGSLAATVRRLERRRAEGNLTEAQTADLICRMLSLAHQRIKAKAADVIQNLAPDALNVWAQECGHSGLTDEQSNVLNQSRLSADDDVVEAVADLKLATFTVVPPGAAPDNALCIVVMDESQSPEFLSQAFQDHPGPRVVVQHNGGRWLIATRGVNILPIVSRLRERVAEEPVADDEQPHLTDIGRPMVGGVRTPIFLDAKKRTCGNLSAQNPFLEPIWITPEHMQRLIVEALAPTP